MLHLIIRYKSKLFYEFNENHLHNVYNILFFFKINLEINYIIHQKSIGVNVIKLFSCVIF